MKPNKYIFEEKKQQQRKQRVCVCVRRTDDGEVDAAVARRRLAEVDAAAVEAGVELADAVHGQRRRPVQRVEEGAPAQRLLVRPVARSRGEPVPSVVPERRAKIEKQNFFFKKFISRVEIEAETVGSPTWGSRPT